MIQNQNPGLRPLLPVKRKIKQGCRIVSQHTACEQDGFVFSYISFRLFFHDMPVPSGLSGFGNGQG